MWKEPRHGFLFFHQSKSPHAKTPLFPNSLSPRPLLLSDLCGLATLNIWQISSGRKMFPGKHPKHIYLSSMPPSHPSPFKKIFNCVFCLCTVCACVCSLGTTFRTQFSLPPLGTEDQPQTLRLDAGPGEPFLRPSHPPPLKDSLFSTWAGLTKTYVWRVARVPKEYQGSLIFFFKVFPEHRTTVAKAPATWWCYPASQETGH